MPDTIKYTLLGLTIMLTSPLFSGEVTISDKNIRQEAQKRIHGYTHTVMLPPENKWHVHDPDRPQPKVVEPKYDEKPVPAPEGATVIYNGKGKDNFKPNKNWKEENGVLLVGGGDLITKESFGDMHLHVEWMIPEKTAKRGWGQEQGNSGVWLMSVYEIQILNGWGNRTYPDGMVGALYGQKPPLVNPAKKPGEWNSFDIHFKAPVFTGKHTTKNKAIVTVYFNNVMIHDKSEFIGNTAWKRIERYWKHPVKKPIKLQYHKNQIAFRNIWVAPLKLKLIDTDE